jgi:hypothetical protein
MARGKIKLNLIQECRKMLENKPNDKFYSRIEIACCLEILLPGFKKERYLASLDRDINSSEYDVYAKEFDDLESTIGCLCKIEKTWNISRYLENNENEIIKKQCMSLMIYNQWENMLDIQMYLDKWRLSGISEYTYEWKENTTKIKELCKYPKYLVAYIPFPHDVAEDEFISKERVIQLTKKWLEIDDMLADFDIDKHIAYMKEVWG